MNDNEWATYKHTVLGEIQRHNQDIAGIRSAVEDMRDAILDRLMEIEKSGAQRVELEVIRKRIHDLTDTINHRMGFADISLARLEGASARISACELAVAKLNVRAGMWGGGLGAVAGAAIWLLTRIPH